MISIITPTWQRHELLLERCMPSVEVQTFRDFEHIIVSDGPDPELAELLWDRAPDYQFYYTELSEHDGRLGEMPRLHGIEVAKGDVIAYLDDDNAWNPRHLRLLMIALEEADFVYSMMQRHWPNGRTDIVGIQPPMYGQIDTSMLLHRRELLDKATWRADYPISGAPDWDIVERWLQAGAQWRWVADITVEYWEKGS